MQDVIADAQAVYYALRDDARVGGRLDFTGVKEAAERVQVELTREVWSELVRHFRDVRQVPFHVVKFLSLFASSHCPRSAISLWAGDGSIASAIEQMCPNVRVVAIEPDKDAVRAARFFDVKSHVDWRVGRPSHLADGSIEGEYELLVSTPPFGFGLDRYTFPSGDGSMVTVSDEEGRLDLLRYADLLSPDARVVLVTGNSLLGSSKSRRTLDALKQKGLWLSAALALPAGTFAPSTSMPATVAIFARKEQDDVFMAELPRDQRAQAQLVQNMSARRPGKTMASGVVLPTADLAPLDTLVARSEVERGLVATGVKLVSLESIAFDFARPVNASGRWGFADAENCLFLPLTGFGPVRTELPEKISRDWAQVVLDPEQALSEYVAKWMSSKLGRRAREALASGTHISHTSIEMLQQLQVPLPSPNEQDLALSLEAQLAALASELQGLSDDLWARPKLVKTVARRVRQLAPDDDVAVWLDSLPFPLATVGRAYYAKEDVRDRIDALFHFFEATAEFCAAILLSGASSDPAYFERAQDELLGSIEDRQKYFEKATLGGWTTLSARLSKELRRMLSQKDSEKAIGRETVFQWFGRPEPEWLEMITSSALYRTLEEAKRHRNDWKGHGGAAGEAVLAQRLEKLETLLVSVQSIVGTRWDDAVLVMPTRMSLSGGTWQTTVDALVGSGVPFRQKRIVTTNPLDSEYLHLIHAGGPSSLQLLPLVKMLPGPSNANIACYFYNRVDGDRLRYVSYYFEEAPEASIGGSDVATGVVLHALGLVG